MSSERPKQMPSSPNMPSPTTRPTVAAATASNKLTTGVTPPSSNSNSKENEKSQKWSKAANTNAGRALIIKPRPNGATGPAQQKVLAALKVQGITALELADRGEVQAPVLLEWLYSAEPAPGWVSELVRMCLELELMSISGEIRDKKTASASTPRTTSQYESNPKPKRLPPPHASIARPKGYQKQSASSRDFQPTTGFGVIRPATATLAAIAPSVVSQAHNDHPHKQAQGQSEQVPVKQAPPPMLPITSGQIIMLDALLLKIGWDRAALERKTAKSIEELTRNEARRWIAWLNDETKGKVSATSSKGKTQR